MSKFCMGAIAAAVLAGSVSAGGYSDPVVAPKVVIDDAVETASSSSATSVVLLMSLIVFGVAAGG